MTDVRPPTLARAEGPVVTGAQRGRDLGYPTANLGLRPGAALPPDGVYFGWFALAAGASAHGRLTAGVRRPALVSVGTNPTFGDTGRTVEAYLYDFDDDLYGLEARVDLERLLRPQARFDSLDALIAAMDGDAAAGRRILAELGWTAP